MLYVSRSYILLQMSHITYLSVSCTHSRARFIINSVLWRLILETTHIILFITQYLSVLIL